MAPGRALPAAPTAGHSCRPALAACLRVCTRARARLWRWVRAIALVWLASLFTAGTASAAESLQPVRAWIDGQPLAQAATRTALPYRWDRLHDHGGTAVFEFDLPPGASPAGQGIYLPRIGNAYRVWLDGRPIADETRPGPDWVNTVHRPRLVVVPAAPAGAGQLRIEIHALAGGDGGLSAVITGPVEQLAGLMEESTRWRVVGALGVSVASLILGALALVVWFQQRESVYLFYGLAELFWSGRIVGHYLTDRMPLPWPWWGLLMTALYCAAFASMCLFGLSLVERQRGRMAQVVLGFLGLSLALLAVCFTFELHAWWRLWRVVILLVCLGAAAVVAFEGWRSRSRDALLLAVVCGIALAAGVRDWLVITVASSNYTAQPWMTYVWMLFGLTMAWLLTSRLHRATQAQARHALELREKLRAQEVALADAFAVQRQASELQAASDERRRVLQDMHDGVGHELLGALQVARQSTVPRDTVTEQIQRALDHLKLTVDVLQEGAQEVSTILGLLRYRLAPRLQSAGIRIEWHVDALADMPAWDTRRARDLQLLLYEAFSNLLAHSGAARASFSAQRRPDGWLELVLCDDGCGLPAELRQGNGLDSMRSRARRLNGDLLLDTASVPGYAGACLRLRLPLHAGSDAGAGSEDPARDRPGPGALSARPAVE